MEIKIIALFANLLLKIKECTAGVDFRFRMLAFRGVGGEPPRCKRTCGISPIPLHLQESRTLRSNQLLFLLKNNNLLEKGQIIFSKTAAPWLCRRKHACISLKHTSETSIWQR